MAHTQDPQKQAGVLEMAFEPHTGVRREYLNKYLPPFDAYNSGTLAKQHTMSNRATLHFPSMQG